MLNLAKATMTMAAILIALVLSAPAFAAYPGIVGAISQKSPKCEIAYLHHYRPATKQYIRQWVGPPVVSLRSCAQKENGYYIIRFDMRQYNIPRVYPDLTFVQMYRNIQTDQRIKAHMQIAHKVCTAGKKRYEKKGVSMTSQQKHFFFTKVRGLRHCDQMGIRLNKSKKNTRR